MPYITSAFQFHYKTLLFFPQTFYTCFKNYSVYSNGEIRQWGRFDWGSDNNNISCTVTFPVKFSDWNTYTVNFNVQRGSTGNASMALYSYSARSYSIYIGAYGIGASDYARYITWEVMGY